MANKIKKEAKIKEKVLEKVKEEVLGPEEILEDVVEDTVEGVSGDVVEEVVAKKVVEEVKDRGKRRERKVDLSLWEPKTQLGRMVKDGKITLDELFEKRLKIKESEIVDFLIPDLETEFIEFGQRKGKFGGGARNFTRQTQRKHKSGGRMSFSILCIVGNKKGYVGLGKAKSKEAFGAKESAIKNAKLNLIKVPFGCGDWKCSCDEKHSIPLKVSGKEGSVHVTIIPALKGTGLVAQDEIKKILNCVGIKDIWIRTRGFTKTRLNAAYAMMDALRKLSMVKEGGTRI